MRKKLGRAEAILHPVRLRVFREIGGRRRTAGEIAAALPDIAQATLYRHLTLMVEAGLVDVAEERRVRGAVEKVYAAETGKAVLTAEDVADASRDDHLRYFATFVTGLLDEYSAYLRRERIDLLTDGVGYRERHLHLDDGELTAFVSELGSLLERWERPPGGGRTPRLLATVLMPLDHDRAAAPRPPGGEAP